MSLVQLDLLTYSPGACHAEQLTDAVALGVRRVGNHLHS